VRVHLTCSLDTHLIFLQLFQQHIADSEWGLIVMGYGDKKRKDTIQRAMERRLDADKKAKDKKPKKVDYLGDMVSSLSVLMHRFGLSIIPQTIVKGLDRDDDYAKKRLLPGEDLAEETWVVRMGA
jgi:hypothetical protein